jgi:hypothetical protein
MEHSDNHAQCGCSVISVKPPAYATTSNLSSSYDRRVQTGRKGTLS